MAALNPSSSNEDRGFLEKTPDAPNTVAVPSDPAAPSKEVSTKRQSLSDIFTIVRFRTISEFYDASTLI